MKTLDYISEHSGSNRWKRLHRDAVDDVFHHPASASPHERAIVGGINAWIDYAQAHRERFGCPIGENYVLGPAWARWGFALRRLLNGETGRLDWGTLDTILGDNLTEQGFDPERWNVVMKFRIEIECQNDPFYNPAGEHDPTAEIASILERLCSHTLREGNVGPGKLYDTDGNCVGSFGPA